MNKHEQAQRFAEILLTSGLKGEWDIPIDISMFDSIASDAWRMADAMQAEADKRNGGVPEAIQNATTSYDIPPIGFAYKFDKFPNMAQEQEWQPDWSVAPDWAEYWFKDEDDCFWWSKRAPYFLENQVSKILINNTNDIAPSFDYQGYWKESIHKRSEGV